METSYYHPDRPSAAVDQSGLNNHSIPMQSPQHQPRQQQHAKQHQQRLAATNDQSSPLSPSSSSSSHSSMSSHGAATTSDDSGDNNAPSSFNSSYGSHSGQKLIHTSSTVVNNSIVTAEVPGGVVTTQNISTVIRPKSNNNSLQFVKINTPELSKKAVEQIKLAEETKISKDKIKEVEEEWQNNLLNWKSKRRQQFVQSVGVANGEEDQFNLADNTIDGQPRKVKTFAEMLEERAKSGTRIGYNLQKYISSIDDEDDSTIYNVHSVTNQHDKHHSNHRYQDHSSEGHILHEDDQLTPSDQDDHKQRVGDVDRDFNTKNNNNDHMEYRPDLIQDTDKNHRTNMQIVDIGFDTSHLNNTSCDNLISVDTTDKHHHTKPINSFRESSTPTKAANDVLEKPYLTNNLNNNFIDSQQKNHPKLYHQDKSSFTNQDKSNVKTTSHIKLVPHDESMFRNSSSSDLSEEENDQEDDEDDAEEEEEEDGEEAEEQRQKQKIAFEAKLKAFENLAKVEKTSSSNKSLSIRKTVTKTNNIITTTFSSDVKSNRGIADRFKTNELSDTLKNGRAEQNPSLSSHKTRLNSPELNPNFKEVHKGQSGLVNKVQSKSCAQNGGPLRTSDSIDIDCSGHLDVDSQIVTKHKNPWMVDSQNTSNLVHQSLAMQTIIPKHAISKGETVKININSPPISSRSMIQTINVASKSEREMMNSINDQIDIDAEKFAKMALDESASLPSREPQVNLRPLDKSTTIKNASAGDVPDHMDIASRKTSADKNDKNLFSTPNNNNSEPTTKFRDLDKQLNCTSEKDKKGVLSVSGRKRCSSCGEELGRGAAAFVVESLSLYYHTSCFRCSVCHVQLSNGFRGVDVRVHANALHCQNCYSKDGLNYSRV